MAENKVVGSLILRTFDILNTEVNPINTSNTFGDITLSGNNVTWKNVNIKSCIGPYLFNKHKRFNLKMTSAQTRHNGLGTVSTNDAQLLVYISGLPFTSESCYNTRDNITNQACLGAVNFTATTTAGTTSPITSGLITFEKPTYDFVNITIDFKSSTLPSNVNFPKDKPVTVGGGALVQMGHWSLVIDIYGIDD